MGGGWLVNITPDVLVIGGGMAGLVAGIVASENGLDTLVLRTGQSATAYSSGAIDIIGYPPEGLALKEYLPIKEVPFKSPSQGLDAILSLFPFHPYGIIGFRDDEGRNLESVTGHLKEAISWLKERLAGSCAALIGEFDRNIFPITVLGTTKPTCLIQETMWTETLNLDADNVLIFAGFCGHADFDALSATRAYLENQLRTGEPPHKVGHCVSEITPFGKPYNISSIELARHFDHEESIMNLASALKPHVDQLGATHIALPPVLGIENASRNQSRLQDELDVEVFELLALPPSVPGLRLQRAMDRAFRKAGGSLLIGHQAVSATIKNEMVESVLARSPRREITISPRAVVLATGKFIGGGLEADENGIRETVFDLLPVTASLHPAEDVRPAYHTNIFSLSPDGHAVFGSGLAVDTDFRPIDANGVERAKNLFCAGSILAKYNYSLEKSGLGVALSTGFAAGQVAAELAKEVD
jgi:glycerol-3-phosphate dehydrogenase subunit B